MSGSWHIYRVGESWRRPASQARIVIGTAAWVTVAFTVAEAEFVAAGDIDRHARLRRLGPDLLSPDFDADAAVSNLRALGALRSARPSCGSTPWREPATCSSRRCCSCAA